MKRAVTSTHVHEPFGHYSVAIEKKGHLFLSGQGPFDKNQQLVGITFESQAKQTLDNIQHLLEDNGYSLGDVVKVNVYLADIGMWSAFNKIYEAYFTASPLPARTVIACSLNGFMLELDCVAIK